MPAGDEPRLRSDRPHLLAARSEHGYTDDPRHALPDEPEAVPPAYQRHLSELAHRRERHRELAAYDSARETIFGALDALMAVVGRDHAVAQGVRAVRRSTDALGARLAR